MTSTSLFGFMVITAGVFVITMAQPNLRIQAPQGQEPGGTDINGGDVLPGPQNNCGALSEKECDLQATAHNIFGFNLPYLSDAPATYPKYPTEAWLDPACSIKTCPHANLRDPLAGIANLTKEQWSTECRDARISMNCTSIWAAKCLPEYYAERKQFMADTKRYYDGVCSATNTFEAGEALSQCFQAIIKSPSAGAHKSCHDNMVAASQKSAMARGPNPSNRWTSGTVNKNHCCEVKRRRDCLDQASAEQVCGAQVMQTIHTLFQATYDAFQCADKLSQCA